MWGTVDRRKQVMVLEGGGISAAIKCAGAIQARAL